MAFFIDTITNQSSTCHGLLLFSSKILPSKQTHSTCSNSNYKLVFGCNSRCLSFYSKSKSQWIVWNCCAFWTTSNQSSWCKIIDARYENLQSILFSKKKKQLGILIQNCFRTQKVWCKSKIQLKSTLFWLEKKVLLVNRLLCERSRKWPQSQAANIVNSISANKHFFLHEKKH